MRVISVRELKAHWAQVEERLRNGESVEVLNRGRPAALIVPPRPRPVLVWDDHPATAAECKGRTAEEVIDSDREGRW